MLATATDPRHYVYNTGGERVTVASLVGMLRQVRPDAQIMFAALSSPIPNCSRISFTAASG
jgi:hypothetical protein